MVAFPSTCGHCIKINCGNGQVQLLSPLTNKIISEDPLGTSLYHEMVKFNVNRSLEGCLESSVQEGERLVSPLEPGERVCVTS